LIGSSLGEDTELPEVPWLIMALGASILLTCALLIVDDFGLTRGATPWEQTEENAKPRLRALVWGVFVVTLVMFALFAAFRGLVMDGTSMGNTTEASATAWDPNAELADDASVVSPEASSAPTDPETKATQQEVALVAMVLLAVCAAL